MKIITKYLLLLFFFAVIQQGNAQSINKALAKELAEIYKVDQKYRVEATYTVTKYGANSTQDNALMQKQGVADLENLAKVEKIIADYGYPGKSLVGNQSKVAFIVVQHNDRDVHEKYLPLFIKAAEKGELDYSLIPLMVDRLRTGKGEMQLYGTQVSQRKGHIIQIFPIEDELNVNNRRKVAGLPPLEDYYRHWKIVYILPTEAGNLNPASLYVDLKQKPESNVEAIGGTKAIFRRLQYPESAKANAITGYVTIGYTVDADGNTKTIEVVKGLGYGCDEEAIRVIKSAKYKNSSGDEHEMRIKIPFPYVENAEQK